MGTITKQFKELIEQTADLLSSLHETGHYYSAMDIAKAMQNIDKEFRSDSSEEQKMNFLRLGVYELNNKSHKPISVGKLDPIWYRQRYLHNVLVDFMTMAYFKQEFISGMVYRTEDHHRI